MVEGELIARPEEIRRKLEEKEKQWLPYEQVAAEVGISIHRLRRLLNTKRVKGRKVRKEGRGYPWRWLTTEEAYKKYQASKKSFREYGLKGWGRKKQKMRRAAVA